MILLGYTLVLFSTVRLVLSTIEITKTNNVLWHQYASNTLPNTFSNITIMLAASDSSL